MHLGWIDIAVLAAYFGLTMGMGVFFARKNTNTEEYFLGGRSFPGWALGLSLLGTSISSVTFIAFPADTFKTTGGFDAVIWTDVLQTLTLIFGSILILGIVIHALPGGFGQIISTGIEHHKFSFDQWSAEKGFYPMPHGISFSQKTLFRCYWSGLWGP